MPAYTPRTMTETTDPILPGGSAGGINTYNEKPLHAALKHWVALPGDRLESLVDGYVVDVVQGDLLIEVQTSNFGAIREKVNDLCSRHAVRLVFPIAAEKWIVTGAAPGEAERRRKSPKRGKLEDLFREMVHLPALMRHENFSLEVLLIREEEVRQPAPPHGRYRKGWIRQERRLLQVIERRVFRTPTDLEALLPPDLPNPFTARELAEGTGWKLALAQKLVYSLCAMDALSVCGRRGRARLYARAKAGPSV
jgi:hypothetical protein